MPGGKYDKTSSNRVDIENDDDEGVQTDFEVARNISISKNPINYKSGFIILLFSWKASHSTSR